MNSKTASAIYKVCMDVMGVKIQLYKTKEI